jgi:hypothetical protein
MAESSSAHLVEEVLTPVLSALQNTWNCHISTKGIGTSTTQVIHDVCKQGMDRSIGKEAIMRR